jgi:hypothetical protein
VARRARPRLPSDMSPQVVSGSMVGSSRESLRSPPSLLPPVLSPPPVPPCESAVTGQEWQRQATFPVSPPCLAYPTRTRPPSMPTAGWPGSRGATWSVSRRTGKCRTCGSQRRQCRRKAHPRTLRRDSPLPTGSDACAQSRRPKRTWTPKIPHKTTKKTGNRVFALVYYPIARFCNVQKCEAVSGARNGVSCCVAHCPRGRAGRPVCAVRVSCRRRVLPKPRTLLVLSDCRARGVGSGLVQEQDQDGPTML